MVHNQIKKPLKILLLRSVNCVVWVSLLEFEVDLTFFTTKSEL